MPILATRPKLSVAWLSRSKTGLPSRSPAARAPNTPNCFRNLPSLVNFSTWESGPPLLPIQMLSMWSMVIPWFDSGQV